ncbi:hypothetical protein PsYK624_024650 [Phanerochaete sordida]|uniref:Uncharacterized protein n=1 Tax=Phanerochaete sordida TaxID=48140 RepID=A0A9P3G2C1_9APHY|nr:hypothetical protein PsYK624_024650 [Phanerochaete sordida]
MPNDTVAGLQEAFQLLSITSAVYASLNALCGVYLVLFVFTIWSTYRQAERAYSKLRVITILLFVVIVIHYTMRSVDFSERRLNPNGIALDPWTTPVYFIANTTTTLAGLISDGLLAWRFYVVFDRARWALYGPSFAILVNAMLGFAGDALGFSVYHNAELYTRRYEKLQYTISAAWGWTMFVTNTVLTTAIIWRIITQSRPTREQKRLGLRGAPYAVVVEAIVESALVTWVGLLLYGISTVAPAGHITTDLDVGFVMSCILPIFFAISQCLITTRLGLANESARTRSAASATAASASTSRGTHARGDSLAAREIEVQMHTIVEVDSARSRALGDDKVLDICDDPKVPADARV